MPFLDTDDGARLFYKDWGAGRPILFLHGWPLTADMWDNQMMVFGQAGFRVIAPDRRGFGRSSQHWEGNTNERFGADVAALIDHLNLENVILIGHSMAGGDICKYVSQSGCAKLSRIVMLGTVPPLLVKTADNPDGVPMSMFDEMRDGVMFTRSDFMETTAKKFFGFNRLTHKTSQGLPDSFWLQAMMAGVKPTYDCIKQFGEMDLTADLKRFAVPTLFIHGDDDQMVPLNLSSAKAAKLVTGAELKVYEGASHAISLTEATKFNQDVMNFIG